MFTVKVKTTDGSVWQMDEAWVEQEWQDYTSTQEYALEPDDSADAFHDYLVDIHDTELPNEEWLYPNAKLIDPSGEASALFDTGQTWPDEITKEAWQEYEPYANGWTPANFEVITTTPKN